MDSMKGQYLKSQLKARVTARYASLKIVFMVKLKHGKFDPLVCQIFDVNDLCEEFDFTGLEELKPLVIAEAERCCKVAVLG